MLPSEPARRALWKCRKVKTKECTTRTKTTQGLGQVTVGLLWDLNESSHLHHPNREEEETEKVKRRLKRAAED